MIQYGSTYIDIPDAGTAAWIATNCKPEDLGLFPKLSLPGNLSDWLWQFEDQPPLEVGNLFWPVGACRWAQALFCVTEKSLNAIRSEVYAGGGYNALPLNMDDAIVDGISPKMFMLPAIPLAMSPNSTGLYLLPLVDQRWFWWQSGYDIATASSWEYLLSSIGSALGIGLGVDTVATAYLDPGAIPPWPAPLPVFLDAVAASVGQRIVVGLDGSVSTQNATTAAAMYQANLSLPGVRYSGGSYALSPLAANDLLAIIPATVTGIFRYLSTSGAFLVYPSIVNTSSLGLVQLGAGFVGNGNNKVIERSIESILSQIIVPTVPATIPPSTTFLSGLLDAMAQQMATDWILWQLAPLRQWFIGILDWEPEGYHDITWGQHEGAMSTRLQRAPWDDRLYLQFLSASESWTVSNDGVPVVTNVTCDVGNLEVTIKTLSLKLTGKQLGLVEA